MNKINLTPSLAYLKALRASWRGWEVVLSELVDNAFDAQAQHVRVSMTPSFVSVEDDGKGCEKLARMFVLGEHIKSDHKQQEMLIGTYGYGLKTTIAAGNNLMIKSIHENVERSGWVRWDRCTESARGWLGGDLKPPIRGAQESGTMVRIGNLLQRLPMQKSLDSMIRTLSFRYTPALMSGREIIISFQTKRRRIDTKLKPIEIPPTMGSQEKEFFIRGKRLRIVAGVLKAGHQTPHYGIQWVYNHRIILPCSDLGTQHMKGLTNVFGFAELLDPTWAKSLNPTKDDIVLMEDRRAIERQLYPYLKPLLEAAQQERQSEVARLIEERLNEVMTEFKFRWPSHHFEHGIHVTPETRMVVKENGTIEADGTAEDTATRLRSKPRFGGINVEFKSFGTGRLEPWAVQGLNVTLNTSNRFVHNLYRHSARDQTPIAGLTLIALVDAYKLRIDELGLEPSEALRILGETLHRIVPPRVNERKEAVG